MHSTRMLILIWVLLLLGGTVYSQSIPGLPDQIAGGKPVTVTVFGLPSGSDAYDINAKANLAVAVAFMQRYPNIKLRPFSFLRVPGAGNMSMAQDTDTLMSMAAGSAPDVLQVNFRQSESFIRQGFLLPLDDYIKQWEEAPGGKEELARTIPSPRLWDVARRVGPDGKEHTYCLPPMLYVMTLMYRKDVLRAAGLNPEHPPKTWDEFYRMCVQVCDPRQGVYAYSLENSWRLTWILWSAGSEILVQDGNNKENWYAAYDDEHAVKGYQFAWKLISAPWVICPTCEEHYAIEPKATSVACPTGHRFTTDELTRRKSLFRGVCTPPGMDAWNTGKQAFLTNYMTDMQMAGMVDPTLIGVTTVPVGPTGISSAEINSTMLGLNGTLKEGGKRDAAWAYIRFRASEEAKRIQTKVFTEAGYARYINPMYLRQFGYEAYLREVPPGWEQTYQQALLSGHPEPYGKNAQQIYNEMDRAWDQVKMLPSPEADTVRALLRYNVKLTNERLIGYIPPKERRKRDWTALAVVLLSLIAFGWMLRYTLATYGAALESSNQRSRAERRRVLLAWLVMLPALAAVILFQYYPLGRGSVIAFQDYQLLLGSQWVGLKNFGDVLFAREFWMALKHSLQFAAIALGCGFLMPVALALLLSEIPKASLFFRIVYFLPSITSGIVITLLWMQLYDPSPYGMINQMLAALHLPGQSFLSDPKLAMFWIILPGIWAGTGPGCIIYLAALRQIPEEYYEAADIDGAGFFAKLRTITIPYLKPLLIINFVGAAGGAFKAFEPVWIMTAGGPADTTRVVGLEVWQQSFMYLRYGYATAMGWILASLLIGFTVFQLRYLSKVQFRLAKSE
ncbi:MAG: extracellular solute-binding protein [Armatimonadota bacterium]